MTYLTQEGKHTIYSEEESLAQAFIREVNNDLNDVKRSFFKIGFRLAEAVKLKYYEELRYDSIIELSEDKFGFKKSTTYGLMQVYHHCRSRDKNDSALTMDKAYEDYNFSQLQEISRLRWGGAERLIRPSDNVTKIKHFVSVWNKDGERADARGCENIDDYLRKTGRLKEAEPEAPAAPNLLEMSTERSEQGTEDFQISGKFETEQENGEETENSRNLEKLEPLEDPTPAPMTDDELIKQSIKRGSGVHNGKFEVVEYYSQSPLQNDFVKFVQNQYELTNRYNFGWFKNIEVNCKTFTIRRESGGKIVMPWTSVAGNISRLITAGEYLTEEEKERYIQWKAEKDSTVTLASEPSEETEAPEAPDEEYSQYNEEYQNVTELTPRRQYTNREYLATLPDEELIDKLLVKILNVYPFRGESSKFLSMLRAPLKEWLNTPHEVTE